MFDSWNSFQEMQDEFNARYDAVSEAFAGTAQKYTTETRRLPNGAEIDCTFDNGYDDGIGFTYRQDGIEGYSYLDFYRNPTDTEGKAIRRAYDDYLERRKRAVERAAKQAEIKSRYEDDDIPF